MTVQARAGVPVRVAVVDDSALIRAGFARMLSPYSARIAVVSAGEECVDLVLYDPTSGTRPRLATSTGSPRFATFTWAPDPETRNGLAEDLAASVSKRATAAQLVAALERLHAEPVPGAADAGERSENFKHKGRDDHGLTPRESAVISLVVQGLSNQEIATRSFLSINSVKTYIRTAYRKMGVRTRTQAVLWGLGHGFLDS